FAPQRPSWRTAALVLPPCPPRRALNYFFAEMESCRKPDHAVGQPDRSARQARSGLPASPAGDSRTGEGTMIMCVYPVLASSPDEDDRQKGMGPQQRAPRSRGSGKNVFIPPSATQEMIVR